MTNTATDADNVVLKSFPGTVSIALVQLFCDVMLKKHVD